MEYKLRSQTEVLADTYVSVIAPEAEAKLHYLLNVLENMDDRTAVELDRIDRSQADEDLKEFIRDDIMARHAAERLPFVNAVEELRAQYRAAAEETV